MIRMLIIVLKRIYFGRFFWQSKFVRLCFVLYCYTISALSYAIPPTDLMQVFTDAAAHDPTYQAEVAQYHETMQLLPARLSQLLPQVSLDADAEKVNLTSSQVAPFNQTLKNLEASVSQTVYNFTQFKQFERAGFVVQAALATLCGQQQDLMMRTARAYFKVLRQRDLMEYTKMQTHYLQQQLKATQALYDSHYAPITDLNQAKGALLFMESVYHATTIDYFNSIQELSELTTKRYKSFAYLNDSFPLNKPNPANVETWLTTSNKQNYFLQAARLSIQAARQALYAVEGEFLPNLKAYAKRRKIAEPVLGLNQNTVLNLDVDSAGIKAHWDIFQSGLTVAETKAAAANLQKTDAKMRQIYLDVMATTRIAYNSIVVGIERVKNIRLSMAANYVALKSAQEAYRMGDITITEVLQIQGQLYESQKLYITYTYQYLLDLLYLKQIAGTLDVESLAAINAWLQANKPTRD